MDENYMKNRDPIKEFFQLTCQSVKINSPHMHLIATINTNKLYDKAITDLVPYFKFYPWIETTI